MNYYQAREIIKDGKSTGKYHYTYMNDGVVRPAGYCRDECPGHSTKEKAEEHYRKYMVDTAAITSFEQYSKCVECEKLTNTAFCYGPGKMSTVDLCEKHLTREILDKYIKKPGCIVSSC